MYIVRMVRQAHHERAADSISPLVLTLRETSGVNAALSPRSARPELVEGYEQPFTSGLKTH
jgi:hypothetical protein